MTAPEPIPVVLDTNVLINLIHLGLLEHVLACPGIACLVTTNVLAEMRDPHQAQRVNQAIAVGRLKPVDVGGIDSLRRYAELKRALGDGEAATLVAAFSAGACMASDEKRRLKREAVALLGPRRIVDTVELTHLAVESGSLSLADLVKVSAREVAAAIECGQRHQAEHLGRLLGRVQKLAGVVPPAKNEDGATRGRVD